MSGMESTAGVGTGSAGGPRVMLLAPMTNWMFQNLIPALRRQCAMTYALPVGDHMRMWDRAGWPEMRRRLMERAVGEVRSLARGEGLDAVLCLLYDDTIEAGEVRAMRDAGVRVVNYHVDMDRQWYRVLRHAGALDLLAVSHQQYTEPLRRRGAQIHYMPMAASPERYGGTTKAAGAEGAEVLMLGSPTVPRVRTIAACREAGVEVDVYGGGWESVKGGRTGDEVAGKVSRPAAKWWLDAHYLLPRLMAEGWGFVRPRRQTPATADELAWARGARFHGYAAEGAVGELMRRAKITLGVNQRVGDIGDRFGYADSRLRDFEAPMSGAFYLVQSFAELGMLYRPGEEVETWSTLGELKEKVRYYLGNAGAREAIAAAGRRRAMADHTWDARLRGLFHRLGLKGAGDGGMKGLRVVANLSSREWCGDSPGCEAGETPAPELAALRK